jgi:hypothetical protein
MLSHTCCELAHMHCGATLSIHYHSSIHFSGMTWKITGLVVYVSISLRLFNQECQCIGCINTHAIQATEVKNERRSLDKERRRTVNEKHQVGPGKQFYVHCMSISSHSRRHSITTCCTHPYTCNRRHRSRKQEKVGAQSTKKHRVEKHQVAPGVHWTID